MAKRLKEGSSDGTSSGAAKAAAKASSAAKAAAGRSIGPVLRLFGVAAIGCTAAGAAVLMYPSASGNSRSATSPSQPAKLAASAPATKASPSPAVRSVPQTARVETTGAAPIAPIPAASPPPASNVVATPASASPAAPPAPPTPAAATPPSTTPAGPVLAYAPAPPPRPQLTPQAGAPLQNATAERVVSLAGVPLDCVAPDLRQVLSEVQARFGTVTVVSAKDLNTKNHSQGSARHKLHSDCKAVDFKVAGDVKEVTSFLKGRPEVNGVETYRNNGVIHVDLNDRRKVAQKRSD